MAAREQARAWPYGVPQAENPDPPAPSRAPYASEEMLYADRKNQSAGTIAYSLILRMILSEKSATFGIML
jgi:hypothetical protein